MIQMIIAQDPGRFTTNPQTGPLFSKTIKYLPPDDRNGFIAQCAEVDSLFVLFWHEQAEASIAFLKQLKNENVWPQNLIGVVLYRYAHFAGLRSDLAADRALRRAGLDDGRVHILAPEIGPHIDSDMVALLLSFADAAEGWLDGPPPFERLVPLVSTKAQTLIHLLAELIHDQPEREPDILERLHWSRLGKDCAMEGLGIPDPPASGVLDGLRLQLTRAGKKGRIACRLCPNRAYYRHNALGQNRRPLTTDADLSHLTNIGSQIRDLMVEGRDIPLSTTRQIRSILYRYNIESFEADALNLIKNRFGEQCGVAITAANADTERAIKQAFDALARAKNDQAAKLLRGVVACGTGGNVCIRVR